MSRAVAEGLELEVRKVSEMYFEGSWFGSLTLLLPVAGLPDSQDLARANCVSDSGQR